MYAAAGVGALLGLCTSGRLGSRYTDSAFAQCKLYNVLRYCVVTVGWWDLGRVAQVAIPL